MAVRRTKRLENKREPNLEEQAVSPVSDPVRFHLNRGQQLLMTVLGIAMLFFALVPPWKSTIDGVARFVGFYPILGNDPATALMTGGAPATIHVELMALILGQLLLAGLFLFGAFALTREDWAALMTRYARDASAMHAAEIPNGYEKLRDRVGDRALALLDRVDFKLSRVRPGSADVEVRPLSMEQHLLRKISDKIARGEVADAEALLLRIRQHTAASHGESHPFVDELDFRYANLLRDRGELAAAEELYHACIERRERMYGEKDLRVATALQSYARLMLMMRRRALAKRLESLASRIRSAQHHAPVNAEPVGSDFYVPRDQVLPLLASPPEPSQEGVVQSPKEALRRNKSRLD